jgi:hypothetical protein
MTASLTDSINAITYETYTIGSSTAAKRITLAKAPREDKNKPTAQLITAEAIALNANIAKLSTFAPDSTWGNSPLPFTS